MNSEINCHKCPYLGHNYDNNNCEDSFLYTCLFSTENALTTIQLQQISDCHYEPPKSSIVKVLKTMPEEEYEQLLQENENLHKKNKVMKEILYNTISIINKNYSANIKNFYQIRLTIDKKTLDLIYDIIDEA